MDREKELFEWVRGMYPEMRPEDKKDAERFFPALAESDDERNWKAVMGYVKDDTLRAWLEKQKKRGNLSKDKEYTLARIIEYLEDNDCPSEWKDLLHDVYSLPYQKEQKPAENPKWYDSMDEFYADALIEMVEKSDLIDRDKKNRLVWIEKHRAKPTEWSEEDEDTIEKAICVLEANFEPNEEFSGLDIKRSQLVERLGSLRLQPHWKPSEEQIISVEELEYFIETELHKDEFIRKWPQYEFHVPDHREGDEYSSGVAVGVGRAINALKNFITNKIAEHDSK